MISVDEELQDKINKVDTVRQAIGDNLVDALLQISALQDIFISKEDGNKRTGESDSQDKSDLQKE